MSVGVVLNGISFSLDAETVEQCREDEERMKMCKGLTLSNIAFIRGKFKCKHINTLSFYKLHFHFNFNTDASIIMWY